jgi:hypothetical protein
MDFSQMGEIALAGVIVGMPEKVSRGKGAGGSRRLLS